MIRWRPTFILAALVAFAAAAHAQSGQALFEKALAKERVEGNLRQAIALYEQVVREFASDRALAARSLFQVGQCYEKLGRAEARKAYERVLRDFGDQKQAVEARARLAALDAASANVPANAVGARRLWEGQEIYPELSSISPDGRSLSFADFSTGNLSVRDLVTGETRPLTGKRGWNESKDFADRNLFSRDGKHIAYSWQHGKENDLRVIGADGSAPRVLFARPDVGFVRATDWSPDNKRLLAIISMKDHNELASISVADGTVTVLKTLDRRSPEQMCFVDRGRYIAYDLSLPGKPAERDIYLLEVGGKREATIVQNPSDDRLLGCSPDGAHIIFLSDRAGSYDAWLLEVGNGGAIGSPRIVKSRLGERTVSVGFSASGRFLYGQYALWEDVFTAEMDPATGKLIVPPSVVAEEGRYVGSHVAPEWSPDGRFLAYFSYRRDTDAAASLFSPARIIVRSVETGTERSIRHTIYYAHRRLRWSADGSRLVTSGWDEKYNHAIYLIDAQSGAVRSLSEGEPGLRYPVWAPHSNVVFYVKGNAAIVRKDVDGTQERTIFQVPETAWKGNIRGLEISPDGNRLAWCLEHHDPSPKANTMLSSIVVAPAAGGEPRTIFEVSETDLTMQPIAWTPDGAALMVLKNYPSARTPKSSVWRVPLDGGLPQQVALGKKVFYQLRFHSDGRKFAFDSGEFKTEIWSLENILPPSRAAK